MQTGISTSYIIQGGKEGADRLAILANVMWPYTHPFLLNAGLAEGMKCLDVGCGNGEITRRISKIIGQEGYVTGIDFDPSVIGIARQNSVEQKNIQFEVMDIETYEPGNESYDFIFCRFILSHLQSPETVLLKLFNALKPGGKLAIEDVDFQGHFSYPPNHAFTTYVHWYEQVSIRKGANPMIGPLLLTMMTNTGLQEISMNVELPTFFQGQGKQMGLLTMQSISNIVISEKLATAKEVEKIIQELIAFTADPGVIMSLPRIFQISGKRSL
jgi:ubiquinone/menaquinone biosynthesis C-methylase UbiE